MPDQNKSQTPKTDAAWHNYKQICHDPVSVTFARELELQNAALVAALEDCKGYLEAIENVANQIGERTAIQSKLTVIRQALARAKQI